MTISNKHTTPADGTFSASGTTAWNAEHDLLMATARLAGRSTAGTGPIEEITLGSNLSFTGTTLNASSGGTGSDVVFADAPCQDFDLTNAGVGGAVTILSKSVTGISAKNQVTLDLWYTVFNSSGSTRNLTPVLSLGGVNFLSGGITFAVGNNATNKAVFHVTAQFSVSATNLSNFQMSVVAGAVTAAGSAVGLATANSGSQQAHNTTTSDLTGAQTLLFTLASDATTATQTLTLNSYAVRRIASL